GRRTPARWRSSRFRAGPCPVGRWPSAALKAGRQSAAILAALETVETAIAALRAQLVALEQVGAPILPAVHPEWVRARLAELEALLREDPIRSRTEIMKHLDGDLTVTRSPRRPVSNVSRSAGGRNQAASSPGRRLLSYDWLRGLDLNQRPLMG